MPGANCCIVDCLTYADNSKYPHLFRVPTSKSRKKGRTNLKVGSLPTKFLPKKSVETRRPNPRRELARSFVTVLPELYQYRCLSEYLQNSLSKIKDPWNVV
eukprot:gene8455-9359_t